jgi:acetyl esterase
MSTLQTKVETVVLRAALGLPEKVQRLLLGKPVVIDGQTLATETQMLLKLQRMTNQPGLAMIGDIDKERSVVDVQGGMVAGNQPIGGIRELTVDGAEGPLAARLYQPAARASADRVPTLLFLHGGGHGLGSLDSHDGACRFLAERSGVQVLSVDYRLAPEHPFPAAPDDSFAAYQWLVKNADTVNADLERLAVGGDSAGGNLAAATALQAAEAGLPLAFQLLVYPVTDFVNRSRSRDLFDGGGYYLERPGMDKLHRWYLPDPAADAHPLASVLLRTEIPANLAPAFIATAGFDPLRDEGEAYGDLLEQHGVPVEVKRYPAMIHGFFNIVGAGRECPANAADIAARLKEALG